MLLLVIGGARAIALMARRRALDMIEHDHTRAGVTAALDQTAPRETVRLYIQTRDSGLTASAHDENEFILTLSEDGGPPHPDPILYATGESVLEMTAPLTKAPPVRQRAQDSARRLARDLRALKEKDARLTVMLSLRRAHPDDDPTPAARVRIRAGRRVAMTAISIIAITIALLGTAAAHTASSRADIPAYLAGPLATLFILLLAAGAVTACLMTFSVIKYTLASKAERKEPRAPEPECAEFAALLVIRAFAPTPTFNARRISKMIRNAALAYARSSARLNEDDAQRAPITPLSSRAYPEPGKDAALLSSADVAAIWPPPA